MEVYGIEQTEVAFNLFVIITLFTVAFSEVVLNSARLQ
jgi:hypothetical protein